MLIRAIGRREWTRRVRVGNEMLEERVKGEANGFHVGSDRFTWEDLEEARRAVGRSAPLKVEWMQVPDLRTFFGLNRTTVYRLLKARKLRSVLLRRPGNKSGRRLVNADSVRQYLDQLLRPHATAHVAGPEAGLSTSTLCEAQERTDRQIKDLQAALEVMERVGRLVEGRLQEIRASATSIQTVLVEAKRHGAQRAVNKAPRMAFTMKETAELLGVSSVSVWRLMRRGLIRPSVALRLKLFPKAEIERFLRETSAGGS